jgi:8-oxo-dGTP pyrophosphatase MutT (NUDIX family)
MSPKQIEIQPGSPSAKVASELVSNAADLAVQLEMDRFVYQEASHHGISTRVTVELVDEEEADPLPKSASVVAINRAGLVLVSPWKRNTAMVTLPGGKADPGESHLACALREFFEETGIRLDPKRMLPALHRDFDGRDYVGYITTEDLSDATFTPAPGETRPFWADREELRTPGRCPYADTASLDWLWLQPRFDEVAS